MSERLVTGLHIELLIDELGTTMDVNNVSVIGEGDLSGVPSSPELPRFFAGSNEVMAWGNKYIKTKDICAESKKTPGANARMLGYSFEQSR